MNSLFLLAWFSKVFHIAGHNALHFILNFALLLHVSLNCLTSSSSYYRGVLLSSCFQSLVYHLTTAKVNLLSVNLVICLTQQNCFQYSAIMSFPMHCSRITSLWMCSCSDVPSMDLFISLCVVTSLSSSFLVVAYVLLAYSIAGKMVLQLCLEHILYHGKCFPP